ncbi:hypothetical protein SAMN05216188_101469 [Lentzea xinjiangensis]|uniref:Lipoprotein n=1 Tax=Lentzea xinjiangensis TaxID=402600 RepID=A0A1H9AN22_9PSEU|nr:hypothetical protein [Lentzea xinjiangensis]SEP78212.1 hypothetical protein SAMN05216188_101469 [Lentzea xinjiangensis]
MRKLAAALLGCLLLAGCAASWQAREVRYEIVSFDDSTPTEIFKLELVGDAPKGALDPAGLARLSNTKSDITGGAGVGDEVLCLVEQEKGSAFGNSNVVTRVKTCKKA